MRRPRCQRFADQSLEVAVPTRSRKFESGAWRVKGESATFRGAWGEAEEASGRALSIAEAIGHLRHTWSATWRSADWTPPEASATTRAGAIARPGTSSKGCAPGLKRQ